MKDEYLKRSDLVKHFTDQYEAYGDPDVEKSPVAYGGKLEAMYCLSMVKTLWAEDVVSVVRCKDCEFMTTENGYAKCEMGAYGIVTPEDYCSRGKQKEDKETTIVIYDGNKRCEFPILDKEISEIFVLVISSGENIEIRYKDGERQWLETTGGMRANTTESTLSVEKTSNCG